MNILIIEDIEYKLQNLQAFLKDWSPNAVIFIAKCFQTGVEALRKDKPDLVLLDMSLPTSERPGGRLEGRNRIFGGKDILEEMEFYDIKAAVIVVTQFERFGEPPNSIDLETLSKRLKNKFPTYFHGAVYYSDSDTTWRLKLKRLLDDLAI